MLIVNVLNVGSDSTCGKIVHIAKYCTENQQSSNVASFENTNPNFRPAQRTMVKVVVKM